MKFLSNFFDLAGFLRDKSLTVLSCSDWRDHDDKDKVLGTRIEVAITEDKTVYHTSADDVVGANLYEKITIKVPQKDLNVPAGSVVTLVNGRGTVYGQYHNQLSIRADDVKAVSAPAQQGSKA